MKKEWYDEETYEPKVRTKVAPEGKTLKELWKEKGRKSRFFVRTSTNSTSKYQLLAINQSKNLATLSHRGRGWRGYFKKYYDLFVLNNPRWSRM